MVITKVEYLPLSIKVVYWAKKAEKIPWEAIEEKYAALFPGKKGMPAKTLRTALGSLLIQKQLQFSDRELVEEIRENPYFQYFIGLPGYQDTIPFVPSLLVEFRKRLTAEVLEEIDLCDDLSKQLATIRTLVEQQQTVYWTPLAKIIARKSLIIQTNILLK